MEHVGALRRYARRIAPRPARARPLPPADAPRRASRPRALPRRGARGDRRDQRRRARAPRDVRRERRARRSGAGSPTTVCSTIRSRPSGSAVSRGIIAQALAGGTTIVTASAILDPRFSARESVRVGRIEEVLCAPVGDGPPCGVLYLQGRVTHGPFTADDREVAETFARHLGPLVGTVARPPSASNGGSDPSRTVRRRRALRAARRPERRARQHPRAARVGVAARRDGAAHRPLGHGQEPGRRA